MLIVSAGMQKSGSALIFNLINEICIHAGYTDSRIRVKNFRLTKRLNINNNLGDRIYNSSFMLYITLISKYCGRFLVKTHNKLTPFLEFLIKAKQAKVIYCYRDPRDVLISAIDHGNLILSNGKKTSFANMVEFDDAKKGVMEWLKVWDYYNSTEGALLIKYEDLIKTPVLVMKKLASHIDISINENDLQGIYSNYDASGTIIKNKNTLHFNVGKINRYKEVLSFHEIDELNNTFKSYLLRMGYTI